MKKQIFGTLVGGLLLFVWQFLSWAMLNIHSAEATYTPAQDSILMLLDRHLDDGVYFLPTAPPGSSQADYQAVMESSLGKPWAQINYGSSMPDNMGMNMLRGFISDLAAVFLLIWLLMKMASPGFSTVLLSSIAVGVIGFLTISYLDNIWYGTPAWAYLLDAVVSWGLVGVWLGWWLNR